jgi:hypothetical protein
MDGYALMVFELKHFYAYHSIESPNTKLKLKTSSSVHQKPTFTSKCSSTEVLAGDQVDLECRAEGIPEPTISWFKEDDPIISNEDVMVTSTTDGSEVVGHLMIKATPDLHGTFRVCAKNVAESAEHSFNIKGMLEVLNFPF